MDIMEILSAVSVMNRDHKIQFTISNRLDVITSLLWDSTYRRINADGLFNLYAKKPIDYFRNRQTIVVSTHVDCERSITKCFTEDIGEGLIKGTYDNALTNTAILSLMISNSLPDNVLVAFTGDEEETSKGANDLTRFLKSNKINVRHIFVLDVTDMAWNEKADYTVENDLWDDYFGRKIIQVASNLPYGWRFVPSDPYHVPEYINSENVIFEEAAEDESWDYDEEGFDCCSICIPIHGNMHSNNGVLARKASLSRYTEFINDLLKIGI